MRRVLTINVGSSTLRFALFVDGEPPRAIVRGRLERIGLAQTRWVVSDLETQARDERLIGTANHEAAILHLLDWLDSRAAFQAIDVVAHRVVHGLTRTAPERVTSELLDGLRAMIELDPEHLPFEIALMSAIAGRHPSVPQFACFDTAFHRSMPTVARHLPIPRQYRALSIERYGFHGLSYAFLMRELLRLGDPAATRGNVILAHLGSGASLAAVRDGVGIDTSMGFTPASGIMMGTRSGDMDPGLSHYLEKTQNMDSTQFLHMVSHTSGLLGVSGTSSDMRDLLGYEDSDQRAAEAIAMFCYQVRKCIGAFAAALGGVDTLVFSGGVGENAPPIRERICRELRFLDIELDHAANAQSAAVISPATSRVTVRVVPTDEELMLALLSLSCCARPE